MAGQIITVYIVRQSRFSKRDGEKDGELRSGRTGTSSQLAKRRSGYRQRCGLVPRGQRGPQLSSTWGAREDALPNPVDPRETGPRGDTDSRRAFRHYASTARLAISALSSTHPSPHRLIHMATADGGAYRYAVSALVQNFFLTCRARLPCSYSLTVFSPSGKLVQIEHALAAVSSGTTSLGIKGSLLVRLLWHTTAAETAKQRPMASSLQPRRRPRPSS